MDSPRLGEAMAQFQKALEINPNYANASINLSNALLENRKLDDAIEQSKSVSGK